MNMQTSSTTMMMSGMDDSSSSPSSSSMTMGMGYFYASASATILFQPWQTTTWAEMLGSCFAVALLAVLYEGLRVGRQLLAVKMDKPPACELDVTVYSSTDGTVSSDGCPCVAIGDEQSKGSPSVTGSEESIIKVDHSRQNHHRRHPIISWSHLIQTAIYFVQLWIGLLMMLVFMTFNIYLCLAVTIGGAFGYYCFSWIDTASIGSSSTTAGDKNHVTNVGNEHMMGIFCH